MSRIQQQLKRPAIEAIKELQTREVLKQLFEQLATVHSQITDSQNEAEKRAVVIPIEDLAAGADIAARGVFGTSTLKNTELLAIGILSQGTPAGIDNSNTCVITVTDDAANTIVTKTYNAATAFPDNDYDSLGALNAANKVLVGDEHLLFSITNGVAADTPAMLLIIEYRNV